MPDPSLIHGRALPAPELPAGTVTVRVVREAIGNNIVGQEVRLTVAGSARTAQTDAEGRAEFPGLPSGAEVRAETTVNGEQLVSEPLTVPGSGGVRVILVAGIKEAATRAQQQAAAEAAAPPVKGVVALGPNSRVAIEFQDDALQMFYILDIVNNARARVDIGGPLILDLPEGAGGATVLQGSSPSATVSGDRLTVTGPFAAGATSVQVAFRLAHTGPNLEVQQTWPVALEQLTVAAEKVGALSIASPQFSTVGEIKTCRRHAVSPGERGRDACRQHPDDPDLEPAGAQPDATTGRAGAGRGHPGSRRLAGVHRAVWRHTADPPRRAARRALVGTGRDRETPSARRVVGP